MRPTTTLTPSDLRRTVRGRPLVSVAVVTHLVTHRQGDAEDSVVTLPSGGQQPMALSAAIRPVRDDGLEVDSRPTVKTGLTSAHPNARSSTHRLGWRR
jgi:hypothetical protein